MFDRTGNHGSGAEGRVPVMMPMVELSCTSMRSVCDKYLHTEWQRASVEDDKVLAFAFHPNWSLRASLGDYCGSSPCWQSL